MHKALKDIENQLKKVDVVIYVLDARIPLSSLNPSLNKIAENKKILYVVNKIDLADLERVKVLLPQLKNENSDYILFNSNAYKGSLILDKVKKTCQR